MGLERLVEDQPQDYVGKAALERLKAEGVDRKLVGIELEGDELRAEMSEYWPVLHGGKQVGHVTDAVWSPGLEKNIGYVWVPIELAAPGTALEVEAEDGETLVGRTAAIPFVDPEEGASRRFPARVRAGSQQPRGGYRWFFEPLHERERTLRVKPTTSRRLLLLLVSLAVVLGACTDGGDPAGRARPRPPSRRWTRARNRSQRSPNGSSRRW